MEDARVGDPLTIFSKEGNQRASSPERIAFHASDKGIELIGGN
jgi:hypothetical protein